MATKSAETVEARVSGRKIYISAYDRPDGLSDGDTVELSLADYPAVQSLERSFYMPGYCSVGTWVAALGFETGETVRVQVKA